MSPEEQVVEDVERVVAERTEVPPEETKEQREERQRDDFLTGLKDLKLKQDSERFSYLMRYSDWLASLSDDFYSVILAGCERGKLCSTEELDKARAVGKQEMPKYVAKNPATTVKWFKGLPEKDRKILETPTAVIPIKRGKSTTTWKVSKFGDLTKEETKSIIVPNHPEVGLLNPENAKPTFVKVEKARNIYQVTDIAINGSNLEITMKNNIGISWVGAYPLIKGSVDQKKFFQSILDFLG